ncbi:MAG TPA: hypothetical protein VGM91_08865 [Conexibacter sp.]
MRAPYGRWTALLLSLRAARRLGAGTLQLQLRIDGADGRAMPYPIAQPSRKLTLGRRLLTAARRR